MISQSWYDNMGSFSQLTELLYRASIKLTILSGILSLVSSNQSDDRLSVSKAAQKST